MNAIDGILSVLKSLSKRISSLEAQSMPRWVFLTTPLTSTSWDGDSYSTTAKTKIDLSAVFSAPAGIKAVLIELVAKDSGSAAGEGIVISLSPTDSVLYNGPLSLILDVVPDDDPRATEGIVPCDTSGDIYYRIDASGAGTMDVIIFIWGYLI